MAAFCVPTFVTAHCAGKLTVVVDPTFTVAA
jgi:hypothetical protein